MRFLERQEVLRRVRFANKFYDPVNDVLRNEYINHSDLEVIRFDRKNWIEYMKIGDQIHFITIDDFKAINNEKVIVINVHDLMWLTECGYGILKG